MKRHLVKWVYMILAIVITIVIIFFAKTKIETPQLDMSIFANKGAFTDLHYNELKVDSFEVLAKRAYGSLISIDRKGNQLIMRLDNTNQLASDYYNNNKKLLDFTLNDQAFEITLEKESGSVSATYIVQDESVKVPNDVIVKMMYKVYNK